MAALGRRLPGSRACSLRETEASPVPWASQGQRAGSHFLGCWAGVLGGAGRVPTRVPACRSFRCRMRLRFCQSLRVVDSSFF